MAKTKDRSLMPKLTFTLKLQAIKSGGGKGLRTRFRPHVHLPGLPQQHSVVFRAVISVLRFSCWRW